MTSHPARSFQCRKELRKEEDEEEVENKEEEEDEEEVEDKEEEGEGRDIITQ